MAKVTLAAVGDISFARKMEKNILDSGPSYPFEDVLSDMKNADVLFGNMESVMIPEDFQLEKSSGVPLQSRDFAAEALKVVKFDVLHMASNHVLDCGWRGLLNTYEKIRESGAQPLGAGHSQEEARALRIVEKNGLRIGFLGYLQAGDWTLEGGGGRVAYLKEDDIISDIKKYRKRVDIIVVSLHGDIEFQPAPSIPRLNLCRKIAENGADLILCHHPHVPQGIEKWGSCLIHYSLGNIVFDIDGYQLNNSPNVSRSHIFYVDIEDGKISSWRRKYFRINNQECRPHQLSEDERSEEDKYYQNLDRILKDPHEIKNLWHENCLKRLSAIINIIRNGDAPEPRDFLKQHGRQLFSDMCHEYLDGLYEIANDEYSKNAYNDFEFKRPYAPYEQN